MPKHYIFLTENDIAKIINGEEIHIEFKQPIKVGEKIIVRQSYMKDLLELVKQNKELRKSIAFYSSETYNAHLERLLDRSEKQIKRYREALEFYAGGKHVAYKLDETDDDLVVDYAKIAHEALEGEE